MNGWLSARGLPIESVQSLPAIGFIVPEIAAAFLRKVEGGYLLMDSLVTNPEAPGHLRNKALDELYEAAISYSSANSCKIIGFTTHAGTLKRSLRHGFKQAAYAVLTYNPQEK